MGTETTAAETLVPDERITWDKTGWAPSPVKKKKQGWQRAGPGRKRMVRSSTGKKKLEKDARDKYLSAYKTHGYREIAIETRRVLRDVGFNFTLLRRAARHWVRTQSVESVAFMLCVTPKVAVDIIDSNIFQSAIRIYQSVALDGEDKRVRGLIEKAMDALEDCLESNRDEIRLKASLATFHLVYVGKHLKMESQALLDNQGKVKWDMIQRDALKASKETKFIEEWMAKQNAVDFEQDSGKPAVIPDKIVELDEKTGMPEVVINPIDYYDPKRHEEKIKELMTMKIKIKEGDKNQDV